MSSKNILRKLGPKETTLIKRTSSQNFINTFRIKTKFNLYKHLDIAKDAIQIWKRMHQFLRSKITLINKHDEESYYFELNENCLASVNLENVKFLKFQLPSLIKKNENELDKILDDLCNLLTENEFSKLIKTDDDLLWRMTFLSLETEDDHMMREEYEYEIIVMYHHLISEGKCSFENVFDLLNIIEKLYKNEFDHEAEIKKYDILPSLENVFAEYTNQVENALKLPEIQRPTFIDAERARNNPFLSLSSLDEIEIQEGKFLRIGQVQNDVFLNLNDLLQVSKNGSTRIKKFVLDCDLTKKLLEKCKNEKAKMSSFLNIIICISFVKLYQKYGNNLEEIVYYTAISLRQFKNKLDLDLVDDHIMGYYVGGLFSIVKNEFVNINDDDELNEKFWDLSRRNGTEFHQRLANDQEKFCLKMSSLKNPDKELNYHFGLSNIGNFKCVFSQNKLIKIEKSFICTSVNDDVHNRIVFNIVNTIDNRLNWLVLLNGKFIDHYLVDDLISFYHETINIVLKN